jgi:hypothetical protein
MSDQIQSREEAGATEISSVEGVRGKEGPEGGQEQKKWTLKGILMMALCCVAPLLLILAISLSGISLVGATGTLLPFIVLLACPVGMYFMIRMMNKK